MGWRNVLIFVFILMSSVSTYAADDVYLGIYEPEETDSEPSKENIRLPFVCRNGQWLAMPIDGEVIPLHYPSKVTLWLPQNEPKSIEVNLPSTWKCSSIGSYQMKKPIDSILLQKARAKEFLTWDSEFKYRPLVLTSNSKAKKPTIPSHEPLNKKEKSLVIMALKKALPYYHICKTEYDHRATQKKWQNKDVEYKKILRYPKITLVSVKLSENLEKLNLCDGPDSTEDNHGEIKCDFCSHWFMIQNNKIKFLGAALSYLDHGDYNSDNKYEWVFWRSGLHTYGYVLFSDNFRTRVKYIWQRGG